MSLACRASQQALQSWLEIGAAPTPSLEQTAPLPQSLPSITPPPETNTPTTSFAVTVTPPAQPSFEVRYHPDDRLYVGDQISMEVIAPASVDIKQESLTVRLADTDTLLGQATFQPYGFDGRLQATLYWVWNTSGLPPGSHRLQFAIPARGWTWEEQLELLPADQLPQNERNARWVTTESQCCNLYYISGSAAERDLNFLEQRVDEQYNAVQTILPAELNNPLGIVFIPRVLGQGGFAAGEVSISYLDRNYTAGDPATILRHEMVHALDAQREGGFRPSLFVEGLAVYLSGGHYRPEPLLPRAAALIPLRRYILLEDLADNFYHEQHELSYLEAGALVEYMVQRWGWEAFEDFYRHISRENNEKPSQSIDRALQQHFQLSFSRLEQDFVSALGEQTLSPNAEQDIHSLMTYYDVIRRYQQELDPSAYFKSGWMLNAADLRERGIVADYWRHPASPINLTLEILLNQAGRARQSGDFAQCEEVTQAVSLVLDHWEANDPQPYRIHPRAQTAWEIVQLLLAAGYEPQRMDFNDRDAAAWVTTQHAALAEVHLRFSANGWAIQSILQR